MKRYLLYDSHCQKCQKIATRIEKELDGWLDIASLHEPAIQEKLKAEFPSWRREPTLMIEHPNKRIFLTGFSMKTYFLIKLGLIKTMRLIKIIGQFTSKVPNGYGRRAFLKHSLPSGIVAALFALSPKQLRVNHPSDTFAENNRNDGERYYGFVLLADVDSRRPDYIADIAGIDPHLPNTHTVTTFDDEYLLREAVQFPIYLINEQFNNLPLLSSLILQDVNEENILAAIINYGILAINSSDTELDRRISLTIYPENQFPSPFPIYPVHRSSRGVGGERLIPPERIQVDGSRGVLLPSENGYIAHWIKGGALYTLVAEVPTDRETILAMLNGLSKI